MITIIEDERTKDYKIKATCDHCEEELIREFYSARLKEQLVVRYNPLALHLSEKCYCDATCFVNAHEEYQQIETV